MADEGGGAMVPFAPKIYGFRQWAPINLFHVVNE
jgi:hypothetical protein